MSYTLSVLLAIYSSVILANTIITLVLWRKNSEGHFKTSLCIWGGFLVNFVMQGLFQEPGIPLLLAFGSYLIVSFALLVFAERTLRFRIHKTKLYFSSGILAIGSLASWQVTEHFLTAALLMALAIALPMFVAAFYIWIRNHQNHIETSIFSAIIFLNGIHFLDYPFLRFHPLGAIIGYSLALLFIVLFTMLIPAVIIRETSYRYQAQLEQEVELRTLELENLSSQNSALLNLVCHDLATPLTVLFTGTSMLRKVSLTPEQQDSAEKYLSRIEKAGAGIQDILEKVRKLQTLRLGKEQLSLSKVSPLPLIQDTIESLKPLADAKNITIYLNNSLAETELIWADATLLRYQILTNLLSNAIKFSPQGGGIQVDLTKAENKIAIKIIDQGIGIPENIMNKLFDFDKPTSRLGTNKERGSGFGLPLVKTALSYMGGEIYVASRESTNSLEKSEAPPKSGSTFTVLVISAS